MSSLRVLRMSGLEVEIAGCSDQQTGVNNNASGYRRPCVHLLHFQIA
jgi:hypothetical protein